MMLYLRNLVNTSNKADFWHGSEMRKVSFTLGQPQQGKRVIGDI